MINNRLKTIHSEISGESGIPPFSQSLCGDSISGLEPFFEVKKLKKLLKLEVPKLRQNQFFEDKIKNLDKELAHLRQKKRGFTLSSFSSISNSKHEKFQKEKVGEEVKAIPVEIRTESQLNDRREDDENSYKQISYSDEDGISYYSSESKNDILPGGVETGNMMHELLEHLDFETVRISSSYQNWLRQPLVRTQIDKIRKQYQRSEETVPVIAEIIWNTMRTPLRLGTSHDSEKLELAFSKQNLRETDFYFPIPSNGSIEIKDLETRKKEAELKLGDWKVDRGFIRGSIDFVFEHNGLIYLVDWKSNMLEDYHPKTLENEVTKHYMLQLQIYTLATTYWFNLSSKEKFENRFGGVLYIFLRGMLNREGVFFFRPDWNDLLDYEKIISLEKY